MLNRIIYFLLALCIGVTFVMPALATDYASSTFIIRDPILSEGGTHHSTSSSFQLRGTIGGVEAIGESTSTSYTVKSGFQYYDDTAPYVSSAEVNDGPAADIDEQTSLDTISTNWSGFSDPESGLRTAHTYDYAIRRTSDSYYWNASTTAWQSGEKWYQSNNTAVTTTPVYLQTSETYYTSVRAYNNVGLVSSAVDSDGVKVTETLSFSLSSFSAGFGDLNTGNNFTATANTTTTVSTNAYNGYIITGWETGVMTNQASPTYTIADWGGTNSSPTAWTGNCPANSECGFGYTTNDSSLSGGTAGRFTSGGPNYAGFTQTGEGDPVADHTANIDGSTGAVSGEEFVISYKISTDASQAAGSYSTTIVYVATAEY